MPTALIVDDEVSVLPFHRELLESEGYAALTATNLKGGTRLWRRAKLYDLIVDCGSPAGDGLDLFAYGTSLIQEPGSVSPTWAAINVAGDHPAPDLHVL